jgi:hypothetical protein
MKRYEIVLLSCVWLLSRILKSTVTIPFKEAEKMQNGTTVGTKEARRKDEEERMTTIDKRYRGTRNESRPKMCES